MVEELVVFGLGAAGDNRFGSSAMHIVAPCFIWHNR